MMKPNDEEISAAIAELLRSEIRTSIVYSLLIACCLIVCIFAVRGGLNISRFKAIILTLVVSACSLGIIVWRTISFIPVYHDYRDVSYVKEENVDVYIMEGTSSILGSTNEVVLVRQNGEKIKLKIVYDYKMSTSTNYTGTVVYMDNSKYIVWYDLSETAE